MARYADIVLPLSLGAFTFELDESISAELGSAVVVPMGSVNDRFYTGIVWRIHSTPPPYKTVKSVVRTLYSRPLLSAWQREFWEWIAEYYMCSLGEVMRVALPAMMKPSAMSADQFTLEEFRPRNEYYITPRDIDQEQLEKIQRRAPQQYIALEQIAKAREEWHTERIPRRVVGSDIAVLQALARKELILLERCEVTEEQGGRAIFDLPTLSAHQSQALDTLKEAFATKSTALLHGITGSGKTEIYIHFIAERLARGEDVLLLVPEIALTAQLIERMERIFGSRVVAYHSKLTARRRTETFLQINNREGGNFVVGVRSAIFLPLKRLKLIIVDEEHDSSYKQSDPSPRYNARDAAAYIAARSGGNALLGSATPSLESWSNSQSSKYGFASLTERYGEAIPPTITISDTIRAAKRGERKGHFNFELLDAIRERIARGEQVILFQNRRGFAPYVECTACGWTPRCPHCNVTLTLHKGLSRLSCHYCGYAEHSTATCPVCNSNQIKAMGFGTEKIEEQIGELIPEAVVERLDRDSVTSNRALEQIIERFESGQSNILVGTQMVTKGFDFSKVTLVGVLNADNLLNSPDFRAEERAYQLITQVAGRAGRRAEAGEVILQTSQPEHRILSLAITKDYQSYAATLLAERETFSYPPYSRIVNINMRHRDRDKLHSAANTLHSLLFQIFGRRLQGPVSPAVDKIRDEYIVEFTLKIEAGASSTRARALLAEKIEALRNMAEFKSVIIVCNVDPQ